MTAIALARLRIRRRVRKPWGRWTRIAFACFCLTTANAVCDTLPPPGHSAVWWIVKLVTGGEFGGPLIRFGIPGLPWEFWFAVDCAFSVVWWRLFQLFRKAGM